MTREYLKKLLPIMQAYVNGETLQYRQVGFPNSKWTDSNNDDIDFFQDNWEYRIKPTDNDITYAKELIRELLLADTRNDSDWTGYLVDLKERAKKFIEE